tara:strand:+ start:611 stop:1957 length:1347 start_codon:yes stop_codon:yes gene_type:complete
MEILNYSNTNDIELLVSDIYNDFLKCSSLLKNFTFDKIKIYFENNKRVLKLCSYYIKYEVYLIHYVFMNPNLNIDMLKYFIIDNGFSMNYDEEYRLISYYLFNNLLDYDIIGNILKFLKNNNYNFLSKDIDHNNIYHYLIDIDISNEIYHLIYSYTQDINCKNLNEDTPFLLACQKNNKDYIDFLLSKNVNVQLVNSNNNNSLMYACMNNNYDLVLKLINLIDVNTCDNQNDNPLFYACGCDNSGNLDKKIIDILLEKGCNINNKSIDNQNALHYASGANTNIVNFDIIKYLLTLDLDYELIDNFNKTFLDYVFEFESNINKDKIIDIVLNIKLTTNLKNSIFIKNFKLNNEINLLKENNIETNIEDNYLLTFIRNNKILNNIKTDINDDEKCHICQDNILNCDNKIIKCINNHFYHKECIYKWFDTPKKYNCPVCTCKIDLSNEFFS